MQGLHTTWCSLLHDGRHLCRVLLPRSSNHTAASPLIYAPNTKATKEPMTGNAGPLVSCLCAKLWHARWIRSNEESTALCCWPRRRRRRGGWQMQVMPGGSGDAGQSLELAQGTVLI